MQTLGTLAAIWRYPVKSLAAQALDSVQVEREGLNADRTSALYVRSGHARTGKPYRGKEHNLLHTTGDAAAAKRMAATRGVVVDMQAQPAARYFDAAPVSLVFDRWIAEVESALGVDLDPLRWRPNFYARANDGFAFTEDDLIDCTIEVGEIALRVRETIKRCVTTTYDVQTGEPDNDVLQHVARNRANVMGVYCEVELAGRVRAGDPVRLRVR